MTLRTGRGGLPETGGNMTGPINSQDNTLQRANLLDYGEITNAIGNTGGGAQTIDLELGNVVTATQTVGQTTYTFSNPTASPEGCSFTFKLENGASNGGTIWPGSVSWRTPNGVTPTLQTSGTDILSFFTVDGGTNWFGYTSGRTRQLIFSSHAKIGTTSGWALGAVNDLAYLGRLPQNQTNATLIIPISGIEVGETITAFSIVGQIESAGNAITIEGDLRVLTAAAADITDASVATVTTGSQTADFLINVSTTGLTQAVASGEAYYVVFKGTSAATTDAVMISVTVTLLRS